MRHLYLLLLASLAFNAFADAESGPILETYLPETEEIMPATEIPIPREADTQSRLWLQLQASGAMAGNRYTLPGQAATLVYQRYLDSFSHPIPEQFELEDSDNGGSSGSSSGR